MTSPICFHFMQGLHKNTTLKTAGKPHCELGTYSSVFEPVTAFCLLLYTHTSVCSVKQLQFATTTLLIFCIAGSGEA